MCNYFTTFVIILFLLCPQICQANIHDGLVGWWKFEEATGTNPADSSGKDNTGTQHNSPVSIHGIRGNALSFNGSNQYVTVTNSASYAVTTNLTISAWLYLNSLPAGGGYYSIFTRGGWAHNLELNSAGTLTFFSSQFGVVGSNVGVLVAGRWQHVAVTYDGSNVKFYLNGVNVGSPGAGGALTGSSSDIYIGYIASSFSPERYLNGYLDYVRMYNRTLTAQEVQDLYNPGVKLRNFKLRNFKMNQ